MKKEALTAVKPTKILRPREKKVIKYIAEGLAPTTAMVKAGYSPLYAGNASGKKVGELKPHIIALMDKVGITDARLLKVLNKGLDSTKCISAIGDANGKSTDFIEVPDYSTRHRYLETGLKLRGHLKTQDNPGNVTQNFLQININPKESQTMTPIKEEYELVSLEKKG